MSARAGRTVLITGGASGLGAALAAEFLARGDRVLVTDRVSTYDGTGASYLKLDVTSDEDWESARAWVEQQWGGLDVLVNNAGIATGGRIDVVTLEEWQGVIDINLLGVVRGCRTFTPMMKAAGSGQIVNTASLAGLVHPPAMASYTAVKAGVVALSESLSYELAPFGIAVSAVCPGFFRTNLASSLHGSDTALDKVAARLIERAPLDATQVAAEVMKGIDAKRMVILPDKAARRAVMTKRFARPLYDRAQRKFGARLQAITTRNQKETS
ncbi:SDR family NAD(P)-dependent oxidoreductase [Nocardioides sp. Kera G14]|uniref:SDR family NAD(P)-dependent oxidoreductase n=1 Tax=Nocardioides sp. Kera G14 TaxID=2884264 RepID=UPI001D11A6BA|nr:SDR family NAD(P)-dependent oxidoreductase [Nocardioides sp. Kera G14]UDY24961.1 SDR family NAD(P)-dependent oxidoreductase [Nocardioides sp. Kera G14]